MPTHWNPVRLLPLDFVVFYCQFWLLAYVFDLLLEMFFTLYFILFGFLVCSWLFSVPIECFSNFTWPWGINFQTDTAYLRTSLVPEDIPEGDLLWTETREGSTRAPASKMVQSDPTPTPRPPDAPVFKPLLSRLAGYSQYIHRDENKVVLVHAPECLEITAAGQSLLRNPRNFPVVTLN